MRQLTLLTTTQVVTPSDGVLTRWTNTPVRIFKDPAPPRPGHGTSIGPHSLRKGQLNRHTRYRTATTTRNTGQKFSNSFTTHQHANDHTKHKTFTQAPKHSQGGQPALSSHLAHVHKRGSPTGKVFIHFDTIVRHPRTPDRRSAQDSRSGTGTAR